MEGMGTILLVVQLIILGMVVWAAVFVIRAVGRSETGRVGEHSFLVATFHEVVRALRGTAQDLEHHRSTAEARAVAVEDYTAHVLRSISSGVVTLNDAGIVTTLNRAASEILGLQETETVGRSCAEVFGSKSQIETLFQAALTRGRLARREELVWVRPDGERIWVALSTSLLKNQADRLLGVVYVLTDLTEIKHLQEQVAVRKQLALMGELSAGLAHEFRNAIAAIQGSARLLAKRLGDDDERRTLVEAIMEEHRSMDRLIEKLLSLGRTDHAGVRQPVDLAQMVRRITMQVVERAPEPRPVVQLSLAAGLTPVLADEVLLKQAVTNVVQNAVDAMPGGGQLWIALNERHSRPGRGRETELAVTDTGQGIPQDQLERIFLPFYTTKDRGTGLGLPVVQKIIHSHNGRVEVESVEGAGTTFRICLPLEPQPAAVGRGAGVEGA